MCSDEPRTERTLSPDAAISWCHDELPQFLIETMNLCFEALGTTGTSYRFQNRILSHVQLCERILASFGTREQLKTGREIGARVLIASTK